MIISCGRWQVDKLIVSMACQWLQAALYHDVVVHSADTLHGICILGEDALSDGPRCDAHNQDRHVRCCQLEGLRLIKMYTHNSSLLRLRRPRHAQVYFVGSDAKVDMRPSSVWLREKTAKWPWKTHLRVGAKRDEALQILSSEGTLLVLCSLVDNMPYVVAEAAVRDPFVLRLLKLNVVVFSALH